tara:strand:+ start:382 stop:726 length:345 start_codon:yes stop_codon:yes gene_type:complete
MNPILDIIFILTWIILFALAMRMIWRGWSSVMEEPKPRKRKIKDLHPELVEVKDGDELFVVKFKPEVDSEGTIDLKFTPDTEFTDKILSKSLRKRVDELEEDGQDDDGDIVART